MGRGAAWKLVDGAVRQPLKREAESGGDAGGLEGSPLHTVHGLQANACPWLQRSRARGETEERERKLYVSRVRAAEAEPQRQRHCCPRIQSQARSALTCWAWPAWQTISGG